LKDLGVDGRMLLKLGVTEWDVGVWFAVASMNTVMGICLLIKGWRLSTQ
jgi:hypothetical protein